MTAATVAPSRLRIRGRRLLVVLGTALAALLVWGVVTTITGDLTVRQPGATEDSTITGGAVVATALVAGFVSWGLLAVFEHFFGPAHRVWRIVGAIVLLSSITGTLAGTDATTMVTLTCLHLVVGAILLVALPGRHGRRAAAN